MAILLIADTQSEPQRIVFPDDRVTKIGRNDDNDIVIKNGHISSYHAEIRYDSEKSSYFLKDLDSHNGTRVNGLRVDGEVSVKESDSIIFGIIESTLLPNKPILSMEPKPLVPPVEASTEPNLELNSLTKSAGTDSLSIEKSSPSPEVEEVCQGIIKRLDLLDDLLERHEGMEIATDLEALKLSFHDLLRQHQVEPYSFDPETEINVDMRKRIEVIETVKSDKANGAYKIVQTLHDGYVRRHQNGNPEIIRKAHVTTCTPLAK